MSLTQSTPFIGMNTNQILHFCLPFPNFLDNNNYTMSDSDQEGFHRSSIQMLTIKTRHVPELRQNIIKCKNAYLFRSPLSLHHELPLYEYPKQLDHLSFCTIQAIAPHSSECLRLVQANEQSPILLSQFFPRKLNCVYNRFRENLILKRDTTILIRNIGNRVRNDQIITFHDLHDPNPTTPLAFSSNFEGGNLHCVFKDRKTGYLYLLLQNDINTHGYNIWFHFRVKAAVSAIYQFVIVNLSKEVKFQQEVALLTYSSLRREYERIVGFKCKETRFRHSETAKRFWSLHFQYRFEAGEEVYFSLCPPYTFSKLLRMLKGVVQSNMKTINVSAEVAGKTELGNYIPCLKIASRQKPSKNCILITARQHPCETVSSFLCDAMIRILTNSSLLVHQLLESYTIFILPMLNPDGVVHGNSRTNLTGYDINRNWDFSSPIKTAENSQIWTYILHLLEEDYQISWAFDLHGHSKELGYFAYFCEENKQTVLLSHFMDSMGNFYQKDKGGYCLSRSKRQSIRGQLYSKLKVSNAVTIQTSYYGFRNNNGQLVQYTQMHFHQMALSILQSIVDTQRATNGHTLDQKIIQEATKSPKIIQKPSPTRLGHEILSDSDPQQDYLRKQERNEVQLGVILGRRNIKFRTKTESSRNLSGESMMIRSNKSNKISTSLIKQGHFSAFKKSGGLDKQKSGAFYAGRRTFSPRSLQKCMERPKIRKKIEIDSRLRSTFREDSQDDEYLKKSFSMRRRFGQPKQDGEHSRQKTYVGGFRTCYQVSGLKTIQYPTTTSAGLDFQANLKSKKQTIKQIRSRQLVPSHLKPRKLSETYYH